MSNESHIIDQLIKSRDGNRIQSVHDYNIDEQANHIYILGEDQYGPSLGGDEPGVEYSMASTFIKNLNYLMRKSADPIVIHMKTGGGSWLEGMAMYDAIKACPNPTTIINYTHASSMSSIIFLAASKRIMMPHSMYMFHRIQDMIGGDTKLIYTNVELLKENEEQMLQIYINELKRQGKFKHKSKKYIRQWIINSMDKRDEVNFNAKETVDYGFADEVFGSNGVYDWSSLTQYTEEQLTR